MNERFNKWGNYKIINDLLEKYNKADISDLLRMKVLINNGTDEKCFNIIAENLVCKNNIADYEKETLCKYILYTFYNIFFNKKTSFSSSTEVIITRFRDLEENCSLFESVFLTYLELFEIAAKGGCFAGIKLHNIFKEIKNSCGFPSYYINVKIKKECDTCNGYGYIYLDKCPKCNGLGHTRTTDSDKINYYKRLYKYEVEILSLNPTEVIETFRYIIENLFVNDYNILDIRQLEIASDIRYMEQFLDMFN